MDPGSFTCLRLRHHQRDVDGNRRDARIGKGFLIRQKALVDFMFLMSIHRKLARKQRTQYLTPLLEDRTLFNNSRLLVLQRQVRVILLLLCGSGFVLDSGKISLAHPLK